MRKMVLCFLLLLCVCSVGSVMFLGGSRQQVRAEESAKEVGIVSFTSGSNRELAIYVDITADGYNGDNPRMPEHIEKITLNKGKEGEIHPLGTGEFYTFQNDKVLRLMRNPGVTPGVNGYADGDTITLEKGMAIANTTATLSGEVLKEEYEFTYDLETDTWTLTKGQLEPPKEVVVTSFQTDPNISGSFGVTLDVRGQYLVTDKMLGQNGWLLPYNGDNARMEEHISKVTLNKGKEGELHPVGTAEFYTNQIGKVLWIYRNPNVTGYSDGDTITLEKGMAIANTTTTLSGEVLKESYEFTYDKETDTWLRTSLNAGDSISLNVNSVETKTEGNNTIVNIATYNDIGEGSLAAEELAKISFDGEPVLSAIAKHTSLEITFANKNDMYLKELNIEEGLTVNTYKIATAYTLYFVDYLGEWRTGVDSPVAPGEEVTFKIIADNKLNLGSLGWAEYYHLIIDFEAPGIFSGEESFSYEGDITSAAYYDMAHILVDGEPLYKLGDLRKGSTELLVFYRDTGRVEILIHSAATGFDNQEDHTFLFKEGFLFPNGAHLASEVSMNFVAATNSFTYDIKEKGVSVEDTRSVFIGKELTIPVTFYPANATDTQVTFTTSAPAIAEVEDGKIIGKSAGTATITVTCADGTHTDTCEVTVVNAIKALDVPENKVIELNEAHGLPTTIEATLSDGTTISGTVTYDTSAFNNTAAGTYDVIGTFTASGDYVYENDDIRTFTVRVSIIDIIALRANIAKVEEYLSGKEQNDYTIASWGAIQTQLELGRGYIATVENGEFLDTADIEDCVAALDAMVNSLVFTQIVGSTEMADVAVNYGEAFTLPTTVQVTYDNARTDELTVTWMGTLPTAVGTHTVNGVIEEPIASIEVPVTVTVTIGNIVTAIGTLPGDKTVTVGNDHGLPAAIELTLADGSKIDGDVTYTGDYSKTTPGIYTLTGTIEYDELPFAEELVKTFTVKVTVESNEVKSEGCGGALFGGVAGITALAAGVLLCALACIVFRADKVKKTADK